MSCTFPFEDPRFKAKFQEVLGKLKFEDGTNLDLASLINSEFNCSSSGGRRKKSSKKRAMRGGQTKGQIVVIIYSLIALLIGYSLYSSDTSAITTGFTLLLSGQCATPGMRVLSLFSGGMAVNPMCSLFNTVFDAFLLAFSGTMNPAANGARLQLLGMITGVYGTYRVQRSVVNSFAGTIVYLIHGEQPPQRPQLENVMPLGNGGVGDGTDDADDKERNEAANALLSLHHPRGGRKRKTVKKQKSSRKNKRSYRRRR